MKNRWLPFVLFGMLLVFLPACKNEFEKIRASGDQDAIYKKAFEYYEAEDYVKAQALFELIISTLRGKTQAEKVYFHYAYTHYHLRKYILAAYYFNNFSNTFTTSDLREEADFMASYSNYRLSPSFRLDQTYTEKAIEGFQLFTNTYPTSERVEQANQLIDEMRKKMEHKAYMEGQLYYDLKYYESATQTFDNLLKEYPESKDAEKVRLLSIRATYQLAENSIYTRQEDRYREANKKAKDFLAKYKKSTYKEEVESILNNSDKQLKRFTK